MFIYPLMYRHLRRGPQVILPKDIGIIIAFSGISKESVCIDAGTGSGWLAISLARICSKVYSYDIRRDFLGIAEKNMEALGIKNLALKNKDIFKGIDERNVDLVVLDLPDSERALRHVKKALKERGSVVGYLPHAEQVQRFVKRLASLGFYDVYTVEVIVRDIIAKETGTRPTTKGIWHTAYLTFARKPGQPS